MLSCRKPNHSGNRPGGGSTRSPVLSTFYFLLSVVLLSGDTPRPAIVGHDEHAHEGPRERDRREREPLDRVAEMRPLIERWRRHPLRQMRPGPCPAIQDYVIARH